MTKSTAHAELLVRMQITNILRDARCCRNHENVAVLCDHAAALLPKISPGEREERKRQIDEVRGAT